VWKVCEVATWVGSRRDDDMAETMMNHVISFKLILVKCFIIDK